MTRRLFQKLVLSIAGLTAASIGSYILFAPQAFYSGYGITLGQDPSMLSELRAPGAGLTALGAIMLGGVVRNDWQPFAIMSALAVYIAFPGGRLVSFLADGVPSQNILAAFAIEIVIAALCIAAFGVRANHRQPSPLARSVD